MAFPLRFCNRRGYKSISQKLCSTFGNLQLKPSHISYLSIYCFVYNIIRCHWYLLHKRFILLSAPFERIRLGCIFFLSRRRSLIVIQSESPHIQTVPFYSHCSHCLLPIWKIVRVYFLKLFIAAGDTALYIAVRNNYSEIVRLLLKAGRLHAERYSRRGTVQTLPVTRFLLTQGSVRRATFKLFLRYNYFDIDCPVMLVRTPNGLTQHVSATAFCIGWKKYHWLDILAQLGSPVTVWNSWGLDSDVPENVMTLLESVPNLQSVCRKVIRKSLSQDIHADVQTLPLPDSVKNYILLADVYQMMGGTNQTQIAQTMTESQPVTSRHQFLACADPCPGVESFLRGFFICFLALLLPLSLLVYCLYLLCRCIRSAVRICYHSV